MADLPGLIIFVKNPVKGEVKTRIAVEAGDAEALDIYIRLLDITRRVCNAIDFADKYVFYSDAVSVSDDWPESIYIKRLQTGQDLGARMKQAFASVLRSHTRAVIIGSDCPELQPKHVHQAFEILQWHDVVLGPSRDGGYYLLGMKKLHHALFDDMPWSQPSLFETSLRRLRQEALSFGCLEKLSDVDTLSDWKHYLSKNMRNNP